MEENKIVKGYDEPFSIVYHDVWDNEDINPQERYIYMCLLRYANFYSKECFPSISTICKKTKYGRATVIKTIKSLEEKGFIVKKGRVKKDNSQDTNLYIVNRIGGSTENGGSTTENGGSSVQNWGSSEGYTKKKELNNKQINNISSSEEVSHIVEYLNLKANKKYKPTIKKTITLIKARLNEGYTIQDFETVIDTKVKAWKDDPKMNIYLRPVTLFSNKFESYLNESTHYKQEEKEQSSVPTEPSESELLLMDKLENPNKY